VPRQALAVPVAPGELVDKITILQIKRSRISAADRLAHVHDELGALQAVRARCLTGSPALLALAALLKSVNEQLWDVEDGLRDCERQGLFQARFIALARSVYHLNDNRARLKRQINELCGSELIEEKSYGAREDPLAADQPIVLPAQEVVVC
jgi:hypothetical protein